MTHPKKLIEVALPLEAINKESAREKSIRHGHPSTLHLWWARRPLAACRAVLFSSLVDDPSEYIEGEEKQREERERLFQLIEELVKWENINNEVVLDKAKVEIARSVSRNMREEMPVGKKAIDEFLATKVPPVLDPFAGGGSIPLEAQRLGLRAYASDLNPVAVLINKALIEIPPKFADSPPMHPPEEGQDQSNMFGKTWRGAEGLAEDVLYYGQWMRKEAAKRIGHLYPKVKITQEMLEDREDLRHAFKLGDELTVIAWLWSRAVKCPNPTCGVDMPLVSSFWLSRKKNRKYWIDPYITESDNTKKISFSIKWGEGEPRESPKVGRGAKFKCLNCGEVSPPKYIRGQFQAGNSKYIMTAIAAEGHSGRVYFPSLRSHLSIAENINLEWKPDQNMDPTTSNLVSGRGYGVSKWHEIFMDRQLMALATFSSLIAEARHKVARHLEEKKVSNADQYANAVALYLSFGLSRLVDLSSTLCPWSSHPAHELVVHMFSRQALPMVWDFGEINPFCQAASWEKNLRFIPKVLNKLPVGTIASSSVSKADALSSDTYSVPDAIVSTDPPYYDQIGYADLSDAFYIWLRPSLKAAYPKLFATLATPKRDELVALQHRFGGDKDKAKTYFENGLSSVFQKIRGVMNESIPFTVFYAFKQNEKGTGKGTVSTGWETMLEGLLSAGHTITGTWPIRTERVTGIKGNINALASSIVLVCRQRVSQEIISRREYVTFLRNQFPTAIRKMQEGNIAPVDLAQAAIGPGIGIFSRYAKVLEADGKPMSVRSALALINQVLDEYLAEQEGEYDADTRWAVAWYEQFGHEQAAFGTAETLSKAKVTSIDGLVFAGILESRAGKVRLLKREELDEVWSPETDNRITTWESAQHLIKTLEKEGEQVAAELLAKLGTAAEPARDLAYRLYTICERKGWAQDALGYNMLVVAWPHLKELASKQQASQTELI